MLEQIEAKLEAGKEVADDADALFPKLGAGVDEEIEFFEVADWDDDADVALFLHVRGTYGLYRMSDSYLNRSCADFIEAFPWLYAQGDLTRATRAFARYLRASAFAESAPPFAINQAKTMFEVLDALRVGAPPADVEELDLSIVEMLGRMAGSQWLDRDSLIFIYEIVRPTLTRLLVSPPTRQAALPYAAIGFWLNADMLWTDDDLEELKRRFGDTERQALRRTAYMVACELEDGSFYRVGSHPGVEDRKQTNLARHFTNVLTQCVTLGDEAAMQAAIGQWGEQLGSEAIEAAIEAARRDAEPDSVGRPSPRSVKDRDGARTPRGRGAKRPAGRSTKAGAKPRGARPATATKTGAKKIAATTKPARQTVAKQKAPAKAAGAKQPTAKHASAKRLGAGQLPANSKQTAAAKPAGAKPAKQASTKQSAATKSSRTKQTAVRRTGAKPAR